ncbi:MAG TPA: MarR family winged helix-turn-helix transcriptional regulator [Geminicoccus sp.]|jgi:DNA-binding MarR family transcriptional regulator|uniref:MarR family winged helix-turn-helix transcriptional regulator n=1 Tax=Geminicoccus sp. TaxID=2024832 RepID=UPI002E304E60|nr:MarR family winged helix-turn-helix transcriptional regulator [Geminicoccus sp.]HEX2526597.1 MarR family winged helix-turn-helix transcriptional regulator [Geminicoccus sp.]
MPASGRMEPRTIDYSDVSFDVLGDLLSFYARSMSIALNRDYDQAISQVELAHGTGKVSVLLMVHANPGIRPSVIAHFIQRDRSAMARLLEQMKGHGLIEHKIDAEERRAHELYLTPKGEKLVDQVRRIAREQSDRFFGVLDKGDQAQLLRILKRLYEHHVSPLPNRHGNPSEAAA